MSEVISQHVRHIYGNKMSIVTYTAAQVDSLNQPLRFDSISLYLFA
jgi:hypothetical protein